MDHTGQWWQIQHAMLQTLEKVQPRMMNEKIFQLKRQNTKVVKQEDTKAICNPQLGIRLFV